SGSRRLLHVGPEAEMVGAVAAADLGAREAQPRPGEDAVDPHPRAEAVRRVGVAEAAAALGKGIGDSPEGVAEDPAALREVRVARDQHRPVGAAREPGERLDLEPAERRVGDQAVAVAAEDAPALDLAAEAVAADVLEAVAGRDRMHVEYLESA